LHFDGRALAKPTLEGIALLHFTYSTSPLEAALIRAALGYAAVIVSNEEIVREMFDSELSTVASELSTGASRDSSDLAPTARAHCSFHQQEPGAFVPRKTDNPATGQRSGDRRVI
jgi:hypothetical protein